MSLGYVLGLYNYVLKDKYTVVQSRSMDRIREKKKPKPNNQTIAGQTKLEI